MGRERGQKSGSGGSAPISLLKIPFKCATRGFHYEAFCTDGEIAKACLHFWGYLEREQGEEGMGAGINYRCGPGSARQVIAADSPVCLTVHLSLSPGPFTIAHHSYTLHNLSAEVRPDTNSLCLSHTLSLAIDLRYKHDMSLVATPSVSLFSL